MNRFTFEISTDGDGDTINITQEVNNRLKDIRGEGLVHLFIPGSTAALTTVEFEPGLIKHDLPRLFQQLAPDDAHYHHEATWNDDNGHSHVRAALMGPALMVPFSNGRLLTGEYQHVVLIDFDTRPRRRKIICTVMV
jgi:secondary thiamine-phosphate synthase enzyme